MCNTFDTAVRVDSSPSCWSTSSSLSYHCTYRRQNPPSNSIQPVVVRKAKHKAESHRHDLILIHNHPMTVHHCSISTLTPSLISPRKNRSPDLRPARLGRASRRSSIGTAKPTQNCSHAGSWKPDTESEDGECLRWIAIPAFQQSPDGRWAKLSFCHSPRDQSTVGGKNVSCWRKEKRERARVPGLAKGWCPSLGRVSVHSAPRARPAAPLSLQVGLSLSLSREKVRRRALRNVDGRGGRRAVVATQQQHLVSPLSSTWDVQGGL